MTFPPGAHSGPGRPLLENAASATISAARQRIGGTRPQFPSPVVPALSPEQRAEAIDVITNGGACGLCGGLHTAEEHGCPRLASFELDGDGKIRAGTFWPDGQYDTSRVVYADPAGEVPGGEG